jgi:proteic killer suppression protein
LGLIERESETVAVVRHTLYDPRVIRSFRDRATHELFLGETPRGLRAIASVARRKLDMLDAAARVEDLRVPPGNRLERLKGDRQGFWSIRVNDQWRICFRWEDGAHEVEIVDYH